MSSIGNINNLQIPVVIVPSQTHSEERQAALAHVMQNGIELQNVSEEFRNDREIVLAAVTQNGWALLYASEELRNDREIVLIAVMQDGSLLQYASESLRNDRGIVLAAVTLDGLDLQHASGELRNDREIVLPAVTHNGRALRYASESLRNDREIVLAAATRHGGALRYASAERRAEFLNPQYSNIVAELDIRNRFKAAVTNEDLKSSDLTTFPPSLQPAITAWLSQLLETKTFENTESASILANQVYEIFAYAKENPEFAVKLEQELEIAQISCSDSSLIIYHTLSTTKKLMQVFTKPLPEIIELTRGLYKISLLELQAFKRFQQVGGDQISISLGFQARLRNELSLPLDFDEVRFGQDWTGLTEDAVQEAREFVGESLKNPEGFVQYLSDLELWQQHLLATDEDVKGKHAEITDQFADRLDELMDAAGTMTDGEYTTQMDALVVDRTQAFKKLYEDATLQIVETVGPSQEESSLVGPSSSGFTSSSVDL